MIYRQSLNSTSEMAKWYDQKYADMNGCWQTPEAELDQHLDDFGLTGGNLRVLDIGCGDGSFVKRMRDRGYQSYGIEVSSEAVARSQDTRIRLRDICERPVHGPFDRIISLGSLEHVIDIDVALDNIRQSLAPGGRWYFYIPNELWKHEDQPNERTATDEEWKALFRKHGLVTESYRRWNDSTAFQGSVYRELSVEIASVICGGTGPELPGVVTWEGGPRNREWKSLLPYPSKIWFHFLDNRDNKLTPCQAYQRILDRTNADVLVMVHDDVEVYDPNWLARIMALFENPKCVVAGLGGATSLGRPNLYKQKYRIENMARGGYASNQRDAETHGERFTGDRRVAVLDAFFMAVRVDWLRAIGGWPVEHLTHHGTDLYLGCMAARTEKEVHMSGIDVSHWGGGTSTKPAYMKADWLQGGSMESDHQAPHRFLFNEFSDVLPIEVRP